MKMNKSSKETEAYWMKRRGFSQKEYEKVVGLCDKPDNLCFCGSCNNKEECEIKIKGNYTVFFH